MMKTWENLGTATNVNPVGATKESYYSWPSRIAWCHKYIRGDGRGSCSAGLQMRGVDRFEVFHAIPGFPSGGDCNVQAVKRLVSHGVYFRLGVPIANDVVADRDLAEAHLLDAHACMHTA